MCGRYVISDSSTRIATELMNEYDKEAFSEKLRESYNVALSQQVPVVRDRDIREVTTARWGFISAWSKSMEASRPRDFRHINAKIETVATSRFFKTAIERSRVVLPADGYYEWTVINPKTKQPHYIHQPDASGLAMAGVLSVWADHSKDESDPERWVLSTAIITRDAHLAPGEVHDRMPALLTPDGYDAWLNPASGSRQLLELLEHESRAAARTLDHYEVSRDVNRVRNDASYLVAPLPASAQ